MKKENLNIELQNTLLRLKLEAETGMELPDTDLPPALENIWLTYVLQIEEEYRNATQITVREFTGNPDVPPESQLSDSELSYKLEEIMQLLNENQIQLHTTCAYDDRVIYKFISEELLDYEIDDTRIPGGMICFIYEEFHPNHDYDTRILCSRFLNLIFSRSEEQAFVLPYISRNITLNGKKYTDEEFSVFLHTFHELHEELILKDFKIVDLHCIPEEGTAKADMEFDYEMKIPGVHVSVANEKITFHLQRSFNAWCVCAIESEALGKE